MTLLDAIAEHGFDAAFGGARRDEERARAKERIFSFRDDFGQWDPRRQRPELWNLYNGRVRRGEHVRVFPLSNWTELDVWEYIRAEELELPSIYFAHEREVFERDGMLYAVVRLRRAQCDGEEPFAESVRYRTVGDMTLHRRGALDARPTLEDVVAEIAATRITERGETRADDRVRGRDGGPQARGLLLDDGARHAAPRVRSAAAAALRHRRLGRRRQVDADRAAAATTPSRCIADQVGRRASSTSRGSPTACAPSASRASRSTSPTATSRPRGGASSSPTRPGHAQYTRNMVTGRLDRRPRGRARRRPRGAADAERAATPRSPGCCGIPRIVLAVNKMDLVGFDQDVFRRICARLPRVGRAARTSHEIACIPVSALNGDNVVERSARMDWYGGPSLLEHLEARAGRRRRRGRPAAAARAVRDPRRRARALRRPARRRHAARRATRSSCCPPASRTRVARGRGPGRAGRGRRGAALGRRRARGRARRRPRRADRRRRRAAAVARATSRATRVLAGRDARRAPAARYLLKHTTRSVRARLDAIHDTLEVATLEPARRRRLARRSTTSAASRCALRAELASTRTPYNRATGAFILIDEATNETVGGGHDRGPMLR